MAQSRDLESKIKAIFCPFEAGGRGIVRLPSFPKSVKERWAGSESNRRRKTLYPLIVFSDTIA
jgi:hypothetical protein